MSSGSGREPSLSLGELAGAVQGRCSLEPEQPPLSPASIPFFGGTLVPTILQCCCLAPLNACCPFRPAKMARPDPFTGSCPIPTVSLSAIDSCYISCDSCWDICNHRFAGAWCLAFHISFPPPYNTQSQASLHSLLER